MTKRHQTILAVLTIVLVGVVGWRYYDHAPAPSVPPPPATVEEAMRSAVGALAAVPTTAGPISQGAAGESGTVGPVDGDPRPASPRSNAGGPSDPLALRISARADASQEPRALVRGHEAHPTRVLVRFKEGATDSEREASLAALHLRIVQRDPLTSGAAVLDTTETRAVGAEGEDNLRLGAAIERQIARLQATGAFAYVEPDYVVHTCRVPDDASFADGSLWGLQNTGQNGGVAGMDVGAVDAWDLTTGDTNVIVAVIDTGIRYTHQDLATQMWRNPGEIPGNGLDDDADGYVDDVFGMDAISNSGDPADQGGHGTHVAGTIGAQANGGGPHVGVAWNVRLMACRFIGPAGGYISDAIKCINYATQHGARVINASWGGGGRSEALFEAIARARAANILFVAAAGNDGQNTDIVPHYPSAYDLDNLVSVAALDRTGALASFSNYGQLTTHLGAPGVAILSCINSSDIAYARADGTSMATPHVAGVAALVCSQFPDASVQEVRDRLLQHSVPTASLLAHTASGGRVNALLALGQQGSGPPVIQVPPENLSTPVGSPAALGVAADGARPLSYQWHFNGAPLPGATRRVLEFVELTEADAGTYAVVVSNAEGSVQSEPATLSLLPPLPISTFAGTLGFPGHADGRGRAAMFQNPMGIVADPRGGFYVADLNNAVIRHITPDRVVSTYAGSPGAGGSADGPAALARFGAVTGVALDGAGNLYVADYGNSTIRNISPDGTVSTLAGKAGETGSADGLGPTARFKMPRSVAAALDGTLFVADSDNHTLRRITPDGVVSTLAGVAGEPGYADGAGVLARFNLPAALVLDPAGNLYVADAGNHTIRKVTVAGVVSTFVGRPGTSGSADGARDAVRFNAPQAITLDNEGNLLVADTGNHTVRRVTPDGTTVTVAGSPGASGTRDGTWNEQVFRLPRGLAVDADGDVFVGDFGNHAIRRIDLPSHEPGILTEPSDVFTVLGEETAIRVVASGARPLTYEWAKDGQPLPGPLGPSLVFPRPSLADLGDYQVRVSNALGSVTSRVAHLVVLPYHPPEVVAATPADGADEVPPNVVITFQIRDRDTAVNAPTIRLWLDDVEVTGELQIAAAPGGASVRYQPALLKGTTTYRLKVAFADRADPPLPVTREWRFTTVRMPIIPREFATAAGTGVEPGFNVRSVQAAPGWFRGNSVADAERQLGNPPQPAVYFSGVATPSLINYSELGAARGNFTAARGRPDQSMREAKLISNDSTNYVSFEITAYLELPAGIQRFGVNSDDGFRLMAGPTTSTNDAVVLGEWDGGRTSADSQFDVFVAEAGLYAFRLIWFQGILNADLEWFTVDRTTGVRTLVNDVAVAGHVKAFRDRTQAPNGSVVPYTFVTLAGKAASGSEDGVGRDAQFLGPGGLALDTARNLYVADTLNHTIRRITPQGEVTTLAGMPTQSGGVNGVGSEARFNGPTGVAVDAAGVVFVADRQNHCVRRVAPDGTVTTWAGKIGMLGSTDGRGDTARFFWPQSLVFGAEGVLYVSDMGNHSIRKITPAGEVSLVAGSPGKSGYVDAVGSNARFYFPAGIATDADGAVYVGDSGNWVIRKVLAGGQVTTFASQTNIVDNDGINAAFNGFSALALNASNVLFVLGGSRVWQISPDGAVRPFAGEKNGTAGNADGRGSSARFNGPSHGLVVTDAGDLFVGDTGNNTIRRITPAAEVTTFAGVGFASADGVGSRARFDHPEELAVDTAGQVYVADKGNQTIRKITPDGTVTTLAGLAGIPGSSNGPGAAARFYGPNGVALDGAGNLYVTENVGSRIRKITPQGTVSTFSGAGMGTQDGAWNVAKFNQPDGIVFAPGGFFYVVDFAGDQIRKVQANGSVTTFAGSTRGFADGLGRAAQFKFPQGIAVDDAGTLYVADSVNFAIRAVTPEGMVRTLAGGNIGFLDGVGAVARFNSPTAAAVDSAGNVLVADTGNHTIRKVRPNGLVTTLAGLAEVKGSADGLDRLARFNGPKGIAVSKSGYLYVADTENSTIRLGIPNYIAPLITRQPQSLATAGPGVTFQVAALSAHPVSFLWRKEGRLIPGETNSTLHLATVTEADAGTYSAVAVNAYGTAASAEAALTFLAAPEIARQPTSLTVLAGAEARFDVEVKGTPPLVFQWQHGGTNLAGAQMASLDLSTVTPAHAGDYAVIVTNALGAVTSQIAVLTVNVPPFLTQLPQDQLAAAGSEVTFLAAADGTGPLEYQWFRGDAPLANAVAPVLVLRDVVVGDSGEYALHVASPYGEARVVVRLTVLLPPSITVAPVNAETLEGTDARFAVEVAGSEPLEFQWFHEGVVLPGATQPSLTLAAVTVAQAGNYTVMVRNPVGTIESAPVALVVNVPPRITTQPHDVSVIEGQGLALTVVAEGTGPLSYQWRKELADLEGAVQARLSLDSVSTNDAGSYSVLVTSPHGRVESVPAVVTVLTAPVVVAEPEDQAIVVGHPAAFGVIATGSVPLAWQWTLNGAQIPDATNALYQIAPVQAWHEGAYQVVITNLAGATTSRVAQLTILFPPMIASNLVDQTVAAGSPVRFTVTASGTEPLSYRWHKDDALIENATLAELLLPSVAVADAGRYTVRVSNPYGEATSAAILTVGVPPRIATSPGNLTLRAGETATFTVLAEGTPPLTFQWLHHGRDLAGQTTSTLVIEDVQRPDAGPYAVRVTNAQGTATCDEATLRVLVPQQLELPELLPNGRCRLRFRDPDGGLSEDLGGFDLEWSDTWPATDPAVWRAAGLEASRQDGFGVFEVEVPPRQLGRFYRLIER